MLKTPVCDLLGIKYPIIQGGMAWLATAELVSAVSNAGGLGIIGTGNASPDWLREQIRLTRQQTEKPFGVNILLLSPYLDDILTVAVEEKVDVIAFGGGNPGIYFSWLKEAGIKLMPVVASVALARRLERSGADIIVAEGMESGGHIGEVTTMALVPQVVDSLKIPVVAAGGIADGRGMAAVLSLGAQGVQIGTRFICSEECVAHPNFKQAIIKVRDRGTAVTGQCTGHPIRCLENKMTRQFLAMENAGASLEELEKFGTGKMPLGVIEGDVNNGSLMAGQIAGLVNEIKPVQTIIEDIIAEATNTITRLAI